MTINEERKWIVREYKKMFLILLLPLIALVISIVALIVKLLK